MKIFKAQQPWFSPDTIGILLDSEDPHKARGSLFSNTDDINEMQFDAGFITHIMNLQFENSMATVFEFGEYRVERTHKENNLWAVRHWSGCYSVSIGKFIYEPRPSSRTDEFLTDTRFSKSMAIELAIQLQKESKK